MDAATLREYLEQYRQLGEYFEPEYKRKNAVLTAFIKEYPVFNDDLIKEMIAILTGDYACEDKFFVADLLYLYKPMDPSLLHPMLNCAAALPDPSFNRIFLKPCISSFGIRIVSKMLARKFAGGNLVEKIRISSLLYWIRPKHKKENDELINVILKQAKETTNLVELYFYQLRFSGPIKPGLHLPQNAKELIERIAGNTIYEDLVFNELNWERPQ